MQWLLCGLGLLGSVGQEVGGLDRGVGLSALVSCTDGKLQWEEEATVNRVQSNEVPGDTSWGVGWGREGGADWNISALCLGCGHQVLPTLFWPCRLHQRKPGHWVGVGSSLGKNLALELMEKETGGKMVFEKAGSRSQKVPCSPSAPQVTLTLTVPEYSNKRVSRPVQVYFYVSNGRRKRSPTQSFKFLPGEFQDSPGWVIEN